MDKFDVCVFGGCSLDMTYYQKEDLTYPDKPNEVTPGGKASNQAVAAARAGANVVILTRVGDDEIGASIIENLNENNVETMWIDKAPGIDNDVSQIYIELSDADNEIRRQVGAILTYTPDMVERYKDVLLASKMVVMQLKAPIEFSKALINFCYDNDIKIVLTPCHPERLVISKPENLDLINKVTYITANERESKILCGSDSVEKCVQMLPRKLLLTLGKDGIIYNNGEKNVHIPTQENLKVVDTTGAGDTFCGNFAALITNGFEFEDAIKKAQLAAQFKIGYKTAQAGMPYGSVTLNKK